MTDIINNAAYVIERINSIWRSKPGKKAVQKLVFLIEQKDIDLGYEYGLHFYGPYSEGLDSDTLFLSADGVIDIEYSGRAHLMSINEENFKVKPDGLMPEQLVIIDELIAYFQGQSPSELELLTTAIYVYNHLEDKSQENIIRGVQKVKGSKYTVEQIQHSLSYLAYFNKHIF